MPPAEEPRTAVTAILASGRAEGRVDYDRLLPLVYGELRAMARAKLGSERLGHTLGATALVHEAFLKLVGSDVGWDTRRHFFGAAAESMRRILIDHARNKKRDKRDPGSVARVLDPADVAVLADPDATLTIDEITTQLEARDPRLAEIVKLRVFAGLPTSEIASMLGIHERSVRREWAFARSMLHNALGNSQ